MRRIHRGVGDANKAAGCGVDQELYLEAERAVLEGALGDLLRVGEVGPAPILAGSIFIVPLEAVTASSGSMPHLVYCQSARAAAGTSPATTAIAANILCMSRLLDAGAFAPPLSSAAGRCRQPVAHRYTLRRHAAISVVLQAGNGDVDLQARAIGGSGAPGHLWRGARSTAGPEQFDCGYWLDRAMAASAPAPRADAPGRRAPPLGPARRRRRGAGGASRAAHRPRGHCRCARHRGCAARG